jgi:hypothetical protein
MGAAERLDGEHAIAEEGFGQGGRRVTHALGVQRGERGERIAHGDVVAGAGAFAIEATASIYPAQQVDIGAGVGRRADGGDERGLVRRIIDRAQARQQVALRGRCATGADAVP